MFSYLTVIRKRVPVVPLLFHVSARVIDLNLIWSTASVFKFARQKENLHLENKF